MMTVLYKALMRALRYMLQHPQLIFVLVLLLFLPLLFLYTGQQFLNVSRENQERLQKDKVGLMHDTFAALLKATGQDLSIATQSLYEIQAQNPDIVDFKIVTQEQGELIILAALNQEQVGTKEANTDLYTTAAVRTDESLIFEFFESEARTWLAYRLVQTDDGRLYFIHTKHSLDSIDTLFKERERSAYFSLLFIYCFVIGLAVWHVRLTDYRFLYATAQKQNEMKDLFTNLIAHELRAPLTAIQGYASIVYEKTSDAQQKTHLEHIKEASARLLLLITDLLDVARIQSGKMNVLKESVDIFSVVQKVLAELSILAKEKQIELVLMKGVVPQSIVADTKRLQQAFTNLVSNAIKYTQKGNISIELKETATEVEVRVKDTGMGIDAENQKKLFAPFFRVSGSEIQAITGTGLGMWISKELIERMGGTVAVESIKGVGTHVVVRFKKGN